MRKNEIPAPPTRIWVVAADAARARIFRAGRLGHATNAARGGGHSLQRNADEPRNVSMEFGRRLARRLVAARRRGCSAHQGRAGVIRGMLAA